MFQEMVQADLINLHCHSSTHIELFQTVGQELEGKGWVTKEYIPSLIQRESEFPTGLQTRFVNIALPHTDCDTVERPFIYIVKNEQPITMLQMGDNAETPCQYFLFLGIKDPKSQVGLLSTLMELFSDEEFVRCFTAIEDGEQMYHVVYKKLSQ